MDNKILSLKKYVEESLEDDCGTQEYFHAPEIECRVGSLNEIESEVFSRVIFDWDNSLIYELANPIIFGNNKYLKKDYLYCKIFSQVDDFESLEYLAENLVACFYCLTPEEYDIELFKKMKFNLLIVLEKTTDEFWKKKYTELLISLNLQISLDENSSKI